MALVSTLRVAAGVAFLLLSACADRAELTPATSFDAAGADAAGGLILVGLRGALEPPRSLNGQPVIRVWFKSLTDDNKLGSTTVSARMCVGPMFSMVDPPRHCSRVEPAYKLLRAPPGRYILDEIDYFVSGGVYIFSFAGEPIRGSLGIREMRGRGDEAGHPERSFTVAPGEITYVGDLTVTFVRAGPRARVAPGRNDAAARHALSEFPGVRGPMVFSPALGSGGLSESGITNTDRQAPAQLAPGTNPGD